MPGTRGGMIVPLVTPLSDDRQVDRAALRRLCDIQIKAGIDGIFLLGTTGEFYGLEAVQQREVVETALEAVAGRIDLLVGISGDSTASSLEALGGVRCEGVAGYVTSTPYFMSYGQEELLDHFRYLGDAIAQPLILYNYPGRYKHTIEISTIGQLLAEQRVSAIKDTHGDFAYMEALLGLKRSFPTFQVFEGALPNLARSAPLGIDGSVQALANLLPRQCAELWRQIGRQDWKNLGREVDRMWAFHQAMEEISLFIVALKGAMALRRWCSPYPTRPNRPVGPTAADRLTHLLKQTYPGWEEESLD